jgi:putative FmdB family regulatory protein
MPIYEYQCPNPKCGNKFEVLLVNIKVIPLDRDCPKCGRLSPKVFSSYNFQFSPYLKELDKDNMVSY